MRKSALIIFLALPLIFVAALVNAANWQYLGPGKNDIIFYFDNENIIKSEGTLKVKQKEVYSEQIFTRLKDRLGEKYADLTDIVNLIEIDCPGKRSRIRSITYYDSAGKAIDSLNRRDPEWLFIPQESAVNILHELYCSVEWEYIVSTKDDDYFLNTGGMAVNNLNVTFWMKAVNKNTKKESERDKFTIKCNNGNFSLRYRIKYKPDGSLSKVNSYDDYIEWSQISPNTIIDSFNKLLCADGQPRKDVKGYLINTLKSNDKK